MQSAGNNLLQEKGAAAIKKGVQCHAIYATTTKN